ncbi:exo-beta-N-acetylmuramidase NamZ family protein [Gemmatimonas sp.]
MRTAANAPPTPVRFGIDRLLDEPGLRSKWRRVGLVTNDAARLADTSAVLSREALLTAGIPVVRLFGPEHGLGARADDGAHVTDAVDPRTGLPVVSLYGERMRPARAHIEDLDVVLFDIPDVGARFYTYAWTLWHVLHACADAKVPLVILDRPNPLGGVLVMAEGPVLEPSCRSFIGEDDIPVRHSLTLGELARLWQREHCPAVALDVVGCEGWDRSQAWPAVGRPWIPTSPAMPAFESAIWYPGTCLFEATNLSVARGTAAPFTMIGAPWLHAEALAREVVATGVQITACAFTPAQGPFAGQPCQGVQLAIHPNEPDAIVVAQRLRPVALGLNLLAAIIELHPAEFAWARYPTAANPKGHDHFARLIGSNGVDDRLSALTPLLRQATIADLTRADDWSTRASAALLY